MNKENEVERSCPECGGTMMRGTRATTVKYGKLESGPFDQPNLWCQSCGEGLLSFKDMGAAARQMHILKAPNEAQSGESLV